MGKKSAREIVPFLKMATKSLLGPASPSFITRESKITVRFISQYHCHSGSIVWTTGYIFVQNPFNGLEAYYQKMEELGKGGFGSVVRIVHRKSLKSYAMKKVRIENTWHREIKNMKTLDHLNVCKCYKYFYDIQGGVPTVGEVVFL